MTARAAPAAEPLQVDLGGAAERNKHSEWVMSS